MFEGETKRASRNPFKYSQGLQRALKNFLVNEECVASKKIDTEDVRELTDENKLGSKESGCKIEEPHGQMLCPES